MTKRILATVTALLMLFGLAFVLTGCGGGNNLVGRWEGDCELMEGVTLIFLEDGTGIDLYHNSDPSDFTWHTEGNLLTIEFARRTAIRNFRISGSRLTLSDPDGEEEDAVLRRVDTDNDANDVIGSRDVLYGSWGNDRVVMIFFEDGTGIEGYRGDNIHFTWSTEGNILTRAGGGRSQVVEFHISDSTLTLSHPDGDFSDVFRRVQYIEDIS